MAIIWEKWGSKLKMLIASDSHHIKWDWISNYTQVSILAMQP